MNVTTMTMPKAQATRMLREYRARLLKKNDDELRAVAEGLAWMKHGRAVINLTEAIRGGGVGADGLPKLAICRSDQQRVNVRWWSWQTVATFTADRTRESGRRIKGGELEIDMGTRPANVRNGDSISGTTIVPLVPPAALAEAHTGTTALARFFTLWEVEKWEPIPPRDPMLLQHLGGDLYVVLAHWDLTELERAVIAGTRR